MQTKYEVRKEKQVFFFEFNKISIEIKRIIKQMVIKYL